MNARTLYLLLIFTSFHAVANAQMFKCKNSEGRLTFQEVPCAAGTTDLNLPSKSSSRQVGVVPLRVDNKTGANWDIGPRPAIPSYPYPVANSKQFTPAMQRQEAQEKQNRKQVDLERQLADQKNAELRKAEEQKAVAFNRSMRCNNARQQLGVAKSGRPVYSFDNQGERQYVSDENRGATITAAERRVAEECSQP